MGIDYKRWIPLDISAPRELISGFSELDIFMVSFLIYFSMCYFYSLIEI